MVGRDLAPAARREAQEADAPVRLELEHVTIRGATGRPRVDDVSFAVRAGEIVGLAGLQGSGKSELLLGLFGARGRRVAGAVRVDGQPYRPASPRRAIRRGLALVTNDRRATGLIPSMSVLANVTLAHLPALSPGGWIRPGRERAFAASTTESLHLRAASLEQPVLTLSGGNQQKVVLARWLGAEPRVLLLDEPTRGVDVGAKQEIYQLLHAWSRAGLAVVLTMSELPELLLVSDRVLVLHRGRLAATLAGAAATPERIMHAAMGGA
jgi:ABC-type sugar transport system ATPase subunit